MNIGSQPSAPLAIEYKSLSNKVYTLVVSSYKEIRSNKNTSQHPIYVKEDRDMFKVPDKLYGDYRDKAYHIFNYYRSRNESVGALFVGEAGTGKTMLAEVICNLAITDLKMPVIMCGSNVDLADESVIPFLSKLDNCCIMMDEFGKAFGWRSAQDKFLSLLTDRSKRILWIFTENSIHSINEYLRNRPGRIRYLINFNKLPYSVLTDYLDDHKVDEGFRDELIDVYKDASKFSFDYLQAIISEHYYAPDKTLNEIISIMNVKSLTSVKFLVISEVKYLGIPIMPISLVDIVEETEPQAPEEPSNAEKDGNLSSPSPFEGLLGKPIKRSDKRNRNNALNNGDGLQPSLLELKFNLESTRFHISMPVKIEEIDDEDNGRRRDRVERKILSVPMGMIYGSKVMADKAKSLKLNKISMGGLDEVSDYREGVRSDRQLFSCLTSEPGLVSINFNRKYIKRPDIVKEFDVKDRDFSEKEFLKHPFNYGDRSKGIKPLIHKLIDKNERFDSEEFKSTVLYDRSDPFTKNQFIVKNKWFEVTIKLVDDQGMDA